MDPFVIPNNYPEVFMDPIEEIGFFRLERKDDGKLYQSMGSY